MSDGVQTALREAGLTAYQAEVYVTLLDHGLTSATDIADECAVPAPRVYDVLRELEENGYVETIDRETIHARPCDPEAVVDDLRSTGELLADAAEEVQSRWQSPNIGEHTVSVVKRRATVLEHAAEAIRSADALVRVVVPASELHAIAPALATAVERGVTVQLTLYVDDTRDVTVPEPRDHATETRLAPAPVPFLALVDHGTTCFSPTSDRDGDFGLLVSNRYVTAIFDWYRYRAFWSQFQTVASESTGAWTFGTLRAFVHTAAPLLDSDVDVRVEITGRSRGGMTDGDVTGTVVAVEYPRRPIEELEDVSFEALSTILTLLVRTDDGDRVTVGGYGAVREDVEAQCIRICDVSVHDPTRLPTEPLLS
jgi:sugar-specific transcriptional regulator TrmB